MSTPLYQFWSARVQLSNRFPGRHARAVAIESPLKRVLYYSNLVVFDYVTPCARLSRHNLLAPRLARLAYNPSLAALDALRSNRFPSQPSSPSRTAPILCGRRHMDNPGRIGRPRKFPSVHVVYDPSQVWTTSMLGRNITVYRLDQAHFRTFHLFLFSLFRIRPYAFHPSVSFLP